MRATRQFLVRSRNQQKYIFILSVHAALTLCRHNGLSLIKCIFFSVHVPPYFNPFSHTTPGVSVHIARACHCSTYWLRRIRAYRKDRCYPPYTMYNKIIFCRQREKEPSPGTIISQKSPQAMWIPLWTHAISLKY